MLLFTCILQFLQRALMRIIEGMQYHFQEQPIDQFLHAALLIPLLQHSSQMPSHSSQYFIFYIFTSTCDYINLCGVNYNFCSI